MSNPNTERYSKHTHRCPNCGFWFECLEEECKDDYSALRDEWDRDGALLRTMSLTVKADAAKQIITALESLMLEGEQKQ